MLASDIPSKFTIPFGNSAGGGYIRVIPTTSQIGIHDGYASLTDGFVPLNFLPVSSGGVPPFGQDFNGLLNQISAWSRWMCAGGTVVYDGAFSSAVGGYPKGSVLRSTIAPYALYESQVDNNTTDPDSLAAANWTLVSRIRLLANTTFYVSISGSDTTGDGTVGNPWRTAQKALTVLQLSYDTNSKVVTIMRAAGAYTDSVSINGPLVGQTSPAQLVFDGASAATVTVTCTGAPNIIAVSCAQVTVQNQTLVQNTNFTLVSSRASTLLIGNVIFGATAASGSHINASNGGQCIQIANYTISGGGGVHMNSDGAGMIILGGGYTVTLTGTPNFTAGFAVTTRLGLIQDVVGTTYVGSATGARYAANLNGVIDTNGQGASHYPGSSAGVTATGGQYN